MIQSDLNGNSEKITSSDVKKALHSKFSAENFLKLMEFDEYTSGRRIDFMAVSLIRSRPGVHGIEIKVSRSDWLLELKNPKKADAFYFCDFYYLCAPEGVWVNGEVPLAWGILQYEKKKIKVIREPTQLTVKYDFTFLNTLIKRITRSEESDMTNARNEGYLEGYRNGEKSARIYNEAMSLKRENERLMQIMDRFKVETGIDLSHTWKIGEISEAVTTVMKGNEWKNQIDSLRKDAERLKRLTVKLMEEMNDSQ